MISISHDLELIYARGEGEKGRGGKGRGKGEKKRGGEKESFLHLEAFPPPVQSNCHTVMHFRERVGGKEGKKGGKGRKKGEKRERRGEKEEGKEGGKEKDLTKDPSLPLNTSINTTPTNDNLPVFGLRQKKGG